MYYTEPKVYAAKHLEYDIRINSRSGGVFTALTDPVLEQGGVVYGCILSDKFEAVHIRAMNKEVRDQMRGSKYVQSRMDNCFELAKEDLMNELQVVFSGTSCQIAALKAFLKKDYDNLLCVDIVCHGVPSPMVWNDYLKWLEDKNHLPVKNVDFRNKKDYDWESHVETIVLGNGRNERKINSGVYTTLFVEHLTMRPSCYECPYKNVLHPSDITLADYWGIDTAAPGFNDHKGVSLVLINCDKGYKRFREIEKALEIRKTKLADSMQPPLLAPFPCPSNREQFWKDYYQKPFNFIAQKYGGKSLKRKLWVSLVKMKRKLL